jgi:hypothetical protein
VFVRPFFYSWLAAALTVLVAVRSFGTLHSELAGNASSCFLLETPATARDNALPFQLGLVLTAQLP